MKATKIMQLPPIERVPALVQLVSQLQTRVAAAKDSSIDPVPLVSKVAVVELAAECNVSEATMLRKLKNAGASPFKLGKTWWVREVMLAEAYEKLERECA